MRPIKKFFFPAFFFLLALSFPAHATHLAGGHLSYQNIGKDSILVTLNLYRDCNGVAMGNLPIQVSTSCGAQNVTLTQISVTDITPVCPGEPTRCDSRATTFKYGFTKFVYQGVVDLAPYSSCCDINLHYRVCCRNTAITNGPSEQIFYLTAYLNRCLAPDNSSPRFVNDDLLFTTLGQDVIHSAGLQELDGDLVTFELTTPLSGANTPVSFNSIYSAQYPIYYYGWPNADRDLPRGFHISADSGYGAAATLQFRPIRPGVSAIAYTSKEYRNGQLVGQVTRDFLIYAVSAPFVNQIATSQLRINGAAVTEYDLLLGGIGSTKTLDVEYIPRDSTDSARFNLLLDTSLFKVTQSGTGSKRTFTIENIAATPRLGFYGATIELRSKNCPIYSEMEIPLRIKTGYVPPFSFNTQKDPANCGAYHFNSKSDSDSIQVTWNINGSQLNGDTVHYVFPDTGVYYYTVRWQLPTGEYGFASDSVHVDSGAIPSLVLSADTTICKDGEASLTATSNSTTITWSPANGLNDPNSFTPKAGPLQTTLYTATVLGPNNCKTSATTGVEVISGCVFPGDANNDGLANAWDIIPIGLGFNSSGPTRSNASTNWVGQPATDWTQSFSSGLNYKYSDCNGNGTINAADLQAILLNYNQQHSLLHGGHSKRVRASLTLEADKDTVEAGDTARFSIVLGSQTDSVDSLYGIAFSLKYDPNIVKKGSVRIVPIKSWLGTPGKDLISVVKDRHSAGAVDIGLSRTDQKSASGFGVIAQVTFVTVDDLAKRPDIERTLSLSPNQLLAVTASQDSVELGVKPLSVIVRKSTVGFGNGADMGIAIYPNPSNGFITISSGFSQLKGIKVYDLQGRVQLEQAMSDKAAQVDLSMLAQGQYLLEVTLQDQGVYRTQIRLK